MAIPQQTIDQILDRIDLVELIGQRVKLKKTGRTYSGCCPFHQEKSPSFHVYRDKQYYHCFGCQANGNAIRFLMEYESRGFPDVVKELASMASIELPKEQFDNKKPTYKKTQTKPIAHSESTDTSPAFKVAHDPFEFIESDHVNDFTVLEESFTKEHQEGNLYDLLENIAQYYEQQLTQHTHAQQYFQQRGLTQKTIQSWRLGYAPEGWQHLEQAFPQDIEGIKQIGLIRTSDNGRDFDLLRDRVIFPIRDSKGRVVGFGGRALNNEIKPKYINSPDSDVFHKNQLLYGLYEGGKNKAQDWLMVEGYMDVIALSQANIHGAVATLGTASNTDHLNILFRRNHRITIAFDGDSAGQKAARRTLEIALPLLNDGRELKFFILPDEHDPDSLIRREGVEKFKTLWEQSPLLSDFLFALLSHSYDISSPEGKSQVMAELRGLTNLLPQKGSYRYLLNQSFREKLGLGKRFAPKVSNDAALSFNIQTRIEDYVIALLISHPFLYQQFSSLQEHIPKEELLAEILEILKALFDTLPEEQDAAMYYVLGATSEYHHIILELLQRTNIFSLVDTPEKAFNLAQEYTLTLKGTYLRKKMKKPQSLQESQHLRKQLNELTKQISLQLLQ
ncbi:DNA primase [Acinetobacter nectaris]|uniref:DNA primase n=1 Tax=Acinetobacter nectaris TaxID=1219382 RepID=UPI001F401511|nr:DNA primase [Acinetobacter nectaris]MCF8998790.1 DNA primase [Acinetobacter nectaris]MCF9027969.1 DNA primase [Acinetobacter nectaris]